MRIATTRKAVPGARRLSQLAVEAGGGILHRHGLAETILVFRQHRLPARPRARRHRRSAARRRAGKGARRRGRRRRGGGGDGRGRLRRDPAGKFAPEAVAALAARLTATRGRPLLAAAGGIPPGNVATYVAAGARLIVTSWPDTARPRDVAVTIAPAPVTAA